MSAEVERSLRTIRRALTRLDALSDERADLRAELGGALRRARIDLGWSARQCALHSGVDPSNLSKIERGELSAEPSVVRVVDFLFGAEALGL